MSTPSPLPLTAATFDHHFARHLPGEDGPPLMPRQVHGACWSHVTCHAANIALFLNRRVKFDPAKREFIGDPDANRLRSEALREPWRAI